MKIKSILFTVLMTLIIATGAFAEITYFTCESDPADFNGKTFDNVSDYNNEMSKLISEGASIEASSSTQIVDDIDDGEKTMAPDTDKTEITEGPDKTEKNFSISDFLPLLYDSSISYIDRLVGDDDELNQEILKHTNSVLDKCKEELTNALKDDEIGLDCVFDLVNQIKEARTQISDDRENNEEVIKELEKRMKKDNDSYNFLLKARPLIDAVYRYYNDAYKMLKNYLLGF